MPWLPWSMVHGKKHPACRADRDIADRQRVRKHLFQFIRFEQGRAGKVGVRFAAAIADPCRDGQREHYCQ
jgi:hypothetical protein